MAPPVHSLHFLFLPIHYVFQVHFLELLLLFKGRVHIHFADVPHVRIYLLLEEVRQDSMIQ